MGRFPKNVRLSENISVQFGQEILAEFRPNCEWTLQVNESVVATKHVHCKNSGKAFESQGY